MCYITIRRLSFGREYCKVIDVASLYLQDLATSEPLKGARPRQLRELVLARTPRLGLTSLLLPKKLFQLAALG